MLIINKDPNITEVNSAAVAHEFRNPLNNIRLSCNQLEAQLREMEPMDPTMLVYLEIIQRNCERLNNLVKELFYTRGPNELPVGNTILNILEESLILAEDRFKLKKVKLERFYNSGSSAYFTNPGQLKMAFLNIIINAVESMEEGNGLLKVLTEMEGSVFRIKFSDNGSGIRPEEIGQLFNPFFSSKKEGLGMGLAITREVLQRANANIDVQSQLGKGSTFTIMFETAT